MPSSTVQTVVGVPYTDEGDELEPYAELVREPCCPEVEAVSDEYADEVGAVCTDGTLEYVDVALPSS